MNNPLVSVCIPVFETEQYLAQCLRSVLLQNFESFEVIIVSDSSSGLDERGHSARRIIHLVHKECNKIRKQQKLSPVKISYYEHHENRGILEVRRTLCSEAKSEYILFVDSDDVLAENALYDLYKISSGFDIIQGSSQSGEFDTEGMFKPSAIKRFIDVNEEVLEGRCIFQKWVIGKIRGVLWGKLIRRNLLIQAFDNIPYTECNFGDDYLISFFLMMNVQRYTAINKCVYFYRMTSGMSSSRKIDNLRKWRLICSTSSVFTIISQWIEENKKQDNFILKLEEIDIIRQKTSLYLQNNIQQLKTAVIPELQPQAIQMLKDFWGESFVNRYL